MSVYAVYADKKTSRVLLIVFEGAKVPVPPAPFDLCWDTQFEMRIKNKEKFVLTKK